MRTDKTRLYEDNMSLQDTGSFWLLSDGKSAIANLYPASKKPDMYDQIASFEKEAAKIGVIIHGAECSREIHRCNVAGKTANNKSGAYWLDFSEGDIVFGWAKNWTTDEEIRFTGMSELSQEVIRNIDLRRLEFEKKREREAIEGLTESMEKWNSSEKCLSHPYLEKKNIPVKEDMRQYGNNLLVPAYDEKDNVVAWQSISADGSDKKYCKNFPYKQRAYYRFLGSSDTVYIAEGMATAYAVHDSTGATVYSCFDAGRLYECSEFVRSKYPNSDIVVASDNDLHNTGQDKARSAAASVSGYWFAPSKSGDDWWDVWNDKGPDFVKSSLYVDKTVVTEKIEKTVSSINGKFSHLPTPPYPINEISDWIMSTMPTPHVDIAIMSAWAMVGAFSGRKDSFLKNPPSVIMTLLAINGAGKDTLSKSMGRVIDALLDAQSRGLSTPKGFQTNFAYDARHINSFRPSNPSMGTAQMATEDNTRISGIRLTSEAGLSKQSKAGDGANVRASALQNSAKDAYGQLYYPATRGGASPAFGVPYTVIDESTPETYVSGMMSDVASGAAARGLMIRIDVSKSGQTNYLADIGNVPANILYIFHRLIEEAVRDEKRKGERIEFLEYVEEMEKNGTDAFISDVPVPIDLRRMFEPDADSVKIINELAARQDVIRSENISNDATLEWAHSVRRPQLIFRMALIAARTRVTLNDEKCIVTAKDMESAIAFVDECHRVSLANSSDYDNKYNRAALSLRDWIALQFSKPEPTKIFMKHGTSEMFKNKSMPYSVLGACGTTAWRKIISEICDQNGKSPITVFKEVSAIGSASNFWTIEQDGTTLKLV